MDGVNDMEAVLESSSPSSVPSAVLGHNSVVRVSDIDSSNRDTWKNLLFDSYDTLFDFYKAYGLKVGYGVKKRYGNPRRGYPKDLIYYIRMECLRSGVHEVSNRVDDPKYKPRPSRNIKTQCPCYLLAKYDLSLGRYKIEHWEDEHNHDLTPPEQIHLGSQNRHFDPDQAIVINNSLNCGISIRSTSEHTSLAVGGRENLSFIQCDLKNCLSTKRQKDMQPGEGVVSSNWLREQSRLQHGFYYDIEVDSNEEVASIFWSDSRMQADYELFGDFVSLDTTFRSDNEQRPLGIFVGFNHHYETVVFGAVLLYDETVASFEWLFQTFLKCMKGKQPVTLMTDQAPDIQLAVKNVLPNTYHSLCSWHISKNVRSHLGPLATDMFCDELHQLIDYVGDEKQFEYSWKKMLSKCFDNIDPSEITWLDNLYSTREQWCGAWVKKHFTAGKTTSQLSEQFNTFSRHYLSHKHSVVTFFSRFQALIDDIRYKQMVKEFSVLNSDPQNTYKKSRIMLHAAKIYTPKIFSLLHEQFDKGQEFSSFQKIDLLKGSVHVFDVSRTEDISDPKSAIVEEERVEIDYDSLRMSCTCNFFDNWWFPCRHILRAMDCLSGFGHRFCDRIPEQYIMKRWCRDYKESIPMVHKNYSAPRLSCFGDRYQSFFNMMVGIGSRICSNEEAYNHMVKGVLSRATECDIILRSAAQKDAPCPSQFSTFILPDEDLSTEDASTNDLPTSNVPSVSKLKEKKTSLKEGKRRLKSFFEVKQSKRKVRRKKECKDLQTIDSTPA